MSNQQSLVVGDVVGIINDRRHWLNGKHGVIAGFDGDRVRVQFDHIGRSREAMFFQENLVKVEDGDDEQ